MRENTEQTLGTGRAERWFKYHCGQRNMSMEAYETHTVASGHGHAFDISVATEQ